MSVWFEGSGGIETRLERVVRSLEDLGAHHLGATRLMPGLRGVELLEQSEGSVTIRTNEGVMTRTGISVRVDPDGIIMEFEEEYRGKRFITVQSHHLHHFTAADSAVEHRIVISEVEASGFLGFFYRKFGSSSIGKAFLRAYKTFLESPGESDHHEDHAKKTDDEDGVAARANAL